jgi:hypothetical protein
MPLRLALSITSLRRTFGEAAVDTNFFNLLTQDGLPILSQRGEFVVTQEAPVSADFIDVLDPLTTQDGLFIGLNQNPLQVLVLEQDFDTSGDVIETQAADGITTQDGRGLLTQRQSS